MEPLAQPLPPADTEAARHGLARPGRVVNGPEMALDLWVASRGGRGPRSGQTSTIRPDPMQALLRSLPLVALALAVAGPASAKVLAEGKPSSGGFYWQKIENTKGTIQYICRSKNDGKIKKDAACNGAKSVKP